MRAVLVTTALAALLLAAPGEARRTALHLELVVDGLQDPVYLTAPAGEDGRLYVVERQGRILALDPGTTVPRTFLDISSIVGSTGGEQGLLSVAFHPDYGSNRLFYVDYTDPNGDTRVAEYRSDGLRGLPGTARQLLFVAQPFENHNGGQLQFGPD